MRRRLLVWWQARRLERAARCSWCGDYRLPGEPEARTAGEGRRVHLDCLEAATDDEIEAATW